jgi:hypothetical protein
MEHSHPVIDTERRKPVGFIDEGGLPLMIDRS